MFYDLFRHISTMKKLTRSKTPFIQYPVNNYINKLDFRKELKLRPMTSPSEIMVKYNPDNRHITSFVMGIGIGVGIGVGIGMGVMRFVDNPIYKW